MIAALKRGYCRGGRERGPRGGARCRRRGASVASLQTTDHLAARRCRLYSPIIMLHSTSHNISSEHQRPRLEGNPATLTSRQNLSYDEPPVAALALRRISAAVTR